MRKDRLSLLCTFLLFLQSHASFAEETLVNSGDANKNTNNIYDRLLKNETPPDVAENIKKRKSLQKINLFGKELPLYPILRGNFAGDFSSKTHIFNFGLGGDIAYIRKASHLHPFIGAGYDFATQCHEEIHYDSRGRRETQCKSGTRINYHIVSIRTGFIYPFRSNIFIIQPYLSAGIHIPTKSRYKNNIGSVQINSKLSSAYSLGVGINFLLAYFTLGLHYKYVNGAYDTGKFKHGNFHTFGFDVGLNLRRINW